MTTGPVVMNLATAANPVELLDRTLLRHGGTVRVGDPDGRDILYFAPTPPRLIEFHLAERTGHLRNHNTPAAARLFDGTVFTLTADEHRARRRNLLRTFGHRGPWRAHVDAAIDAWVRAAGDCEVIDLLDQTRRLANAIFARVVFGVDPRSPEGEAIGRLSARFVAGAVAAAGTEPDPDVLAAAHAARDELDRLFTNLRSRSEAEGAPLLDGRDLGAVLIASIETTANLLGWAVARWLRAEPSERLDLDAFAQRVEVLDSPNTLITREVVQAFRFDGVDLTAGTLIAYSPATLTGGDVTFGSGARAWPGQALAQYTVRRTLTALTTVPWSLVADKAPTPRAWLPVRTFGPGTLVRTSAESSQ